VRLTIYSKPGCHLCDEMKAVVKEAINGREGLSLEEIDISNDPALLALYELEIPVLMIDGKKAAKYRIAEEELTRRLDGRAKGKGRSP
jgi:glutaredoxin